MKKENNVSIHKLLLELNKAIKSEFMHVTSIQHFCVKCIENKLTTDENNSKFLNEAITAFNAIKDELKLSVSDVQFSIFLANYERVKKFKLVDKKGNKKELFSYFSYLDVISRVKKESMKTTLPVQLQPEFLSVPEIGANNKKANKQNKKSKIAA